MTEDKIAIYKEMEEVRRQIDILQKRLAFLESQFYGYNNEYIWPEGSNVLKPLVKFEN